MNVFAQLDNEMWLVNRLKLHGARVFDGITDPVVRKERVRVAIEKVGSLVIVGRGKDGSGVTYAQAYENLYGEPLVPPREVRANGRAVDATPGLPAAAK